MLIGAQKSGTTYLFNLLEQDALIARASSKEPMIFSSPRNDRKDFFSFFQLNASCRFALDASTSYLHVEGTADRVAERLGTEFPIVAVLRDPVERATSGYLHEVKHGRELRDPDTVFDLPSSSLEEIIVEEHRRLEDAWRIGLIQPHRRPSDRYRDPMFQFRYVANSIYSVQLAPWLDRFPKVYLVDFARLRRDPLDSVNRIRTAIGLKTRQDISIDAPRNETRLRMRKALRKNRELEFDYRRPFTTTVAFQLFRLFVRLRNKRPLIPDALANAIREDFSHFRRITKDHWL